MAGDDFAELLRTLKERSGLSYGVLGKRLHMSASTLHRYVNGDVVPVEYAPVERLARVCRATPEELLELHRRWVRADALRGVKGEAGTGTSPGPGTASSAAPDAAKAPEAAAPAEAPKTASAPAASDVPDTAAPGGTDADAAANPDADSTVSEFHDPVTRLAPTGSGSGARPRRPRRTALLAGGGVAAVAAVALLVSLLPGDGGRGTGDTKGAAATVSSERSPSHATRKASRSASTSPSPTSSRKHTASPKATTSRAAGPGGSGGSGGSGESSGVPLAVTTNPYYWDAPCEQSFLVDRRPENVPPPPVQQNVVGWITPFDGVAADSQMVSLTIQGTGHETVVLRELHVRVVSSNPPLGWSKYAMGIGCGGGVDTKSFDVSLDQGNPLAMPIGGQRNFPYRVSESDPEVFFVNAHTSGHDVRWYLELDWSSGTRKGTLRIDDHGRPFRTSAGEKSYYAYALTGDGGWERVEDPT
ncbi:helix-turn-helix transcriptional regulator [Streptomyces sp. B3I8]|uniref:helix-turn-helix domain-containing protein n=1 Tax=Streptomyces sp. B3I8 TaxID=3042303 RepID=UPI002787DDF8|nr:helix-turn-helix transcriptional regulator [Streptomyces sp. B3I8]MDQ0788458.1 hypothetical protein [Streptomyces sp. B3I8]